MSVLIEQFNRQLLQKLSHPQLRQKGSIWINFRKLILLFEGCDPYLIDVCRWNNYRIWSLLDKPQKLINLVVGYRESIQKMNPQNIDLVKFKLNEGDHPFSIYLFKLIKYLISVYQDLLYEEEMAMKCFDSSDDQENQLQRLDTRQSMSNLRQNTPRALSENRAEQLHQQIKEQRQKLQCLEREYYQTRTNSLNKIDKIDRILNSFNRKSK